MKLVFFSNYFNSHQKPLADEFIKILGEDNYKFVATDYVKADENIFQVGTEFDNAPCVIKYYQNPEEAQKIINEAECVVIGGLPVGLIRERLGMGKLTFMYSERFFKGPLSKDILRFAKYYLYSGGRRAARNPKANFYLLCAGGFVKNDYEICGLFKNKAYKWGYFPEIKNYDDIKKLIASKENNNILWAGRMLNWKHPELAVMLAKNLKSKNINFKLKIIGSGPEYEKISLMLDEFNLRDCVELTGAMSREQVRAEMERAKIFLFTSDRHEGWGAVLNEAMSSACAVVAAEKIGSAPYLVKNNENGLIFRDKNSADLTEKVTELLKNPDKANALGLKAYETMRETWNAETAAKRFITLSEALKINGEAQKLFSEGPCTPA